jgi:hypothetical protein
MGFFYWGEENNPSRQAPARQTPTRPNYHRAPHRTIDPRTVKWANTPLDESAVREYERNPNRRSSDGDPFVVVGKDGVARGWNGKHRATAAMRQGRKLRVRFWDGR